MSWELIKGISCIGLGIVGLIVMWYIIEKDDYSNE